jgi:radical SAM protein with 4Fe4S-binding SPASM domain
MIAQIETNTYCNQSCWYCQNSCYPRRADSVMSMDLFGHVLKEILICYPESEPIVSFAAYNEPTFDPHLKERLDALKKAGFSFSFFSNGMNLTRDLVDFMAREKPGIMDFFFNIPAFEPDEYQRLAGAPAGNIFRITENLFYLCSKKDQIGSRISINVHGDMGESHRSNHLRAKAIFNPLGVNVLFQGIMNRAGMLDDRIPQSVDHRTDQLLCSMRRFEDLYIGVEGNVYLCCHDYYQKYTYGNLREVPLKDLLTSRARKNTVRQFRKDFCRSCSQAYSIERAGEALRRARGEISPVNTKSCDANCPS